VAFRFWGKISAKNGKYFLTSPDFEPYSEHYYLPDYSPVYPLTEGVSQKYLFNLIGIVLSDNTPIDDPIPEGVRREYGLMSLLDAMRAIHRPKDYEQLDRARERFIFEELDADELQFDIDVYRTILDCYRKEWEIRGDGVEVPMHIFINHHNPDVSRVSIELFTSDDNYVISKIWEQKEVHIESDEEQLAEGVPKAMVLFKWRALDKRMAELKALMAEREDNEDIVAQFAKYQSVRVEIAKTAGRLI
jgi:hypothetical protein